MSHDSKRDDLADPQTTFTAKQAINYVRQSIERAASSRFSYALKSWHVASRRGTGIERIEHGNSSITSHFQQKGLGKARVAAARKLGIRLWILLRDQIDDDEFCRRAPSPATAP